MKTWEAVLAPIGKLSADGRMLAAGVDLAPLPLPRPLRYLPEPGSTGRIELVGMVTSMGVVGDNVVAAGRFDEPAAVDLTDLGRLAVVHRAYQAVEAGDLFPAMDLADMRHEVTDRDGSLRIRITSARVAAVTLVRHPAFSESRIWLKPMDSTESLRAYLLSLRDERLRAIHRPGTPESYRQQGEINMLTAVLRLITDQAR